jgi:hypothetical protein
MVCDDNLQNKNKDFDAHCGTPKKNVCYLTQKRKIFSKGFPEFFQKSEHISKCAFYC